MSFSVVRNKNFKTDIVVKQDYVKTDEIVLKCKEVEPSKYEFEVSLKDDVSTIIDGYLEVFTKAKELNLKTILVPLFDIENIKLNKILDLVINQIDKYTKVNDLDVYLFLDPLEPLLDLKTYEKIDKYYKDNYSPLPEGFDLALKHDLTAETILKGLESKTFEFEQEDSFNEFLFDIVDNSLIEDEKICQGIMPLEDFLNIQNSKKCKLDKDTVLAFCFRLGLNLLDAEELLIKAGYFLTRSNPRDVYLKACFRYGIKDLYLVDDVLLRYHLETILKY